MKGKQTKSIELLINIVFVASDFYGNNKYLSSLPIAMHYFVGLLCPKVMKIAASASFVYL